MRASQIFGSSLLKCSTAFSVSLAMAEESQQLLEDLSESGEEINVSRPSHAVQCCCRMCCSFSHAQGAGYKAGCGESACIQSYAIGTIGVDSFTFRKQ